MQVAWLRWITGILCIAPFALASGLGTVQVIVRAPSGRPIGQTQLTVRSTSVNHIALGVTIAAALVLVVLWSRRLFRRPTS